LWLTTARRLWLNVGMTKTENITRSRRLSDLAIRCSDKAWDAGDRESFWFARCDGFLAASVEVAR
jgi:hypothetical protein